MGNKKLKIGFVNCLYATPKGHSYVVKDMINLLKGADHEIHMYRIGENPISYEFPQPDTLKSLRGRSIPKHEFEEWLDNIKPDYCVFMEYNQWWPEDHDKLEICKNLGIKTIGFLVYEKLDWSKIDHYKLYHKIVSPTGFQTKLMRKHELFNTVHVPWGVNFKEFDEVIEPSREKGIVKFYHCAGSGGVGNRKNTEAIIAAYKLIRDKNTRLFISHLGNKIFSRKDIISFMKYSDVVINTAKWDTIGLNTLEANVCGRPVIVVKMEPMTELVKNNINGFTVIGEKGMNENVTCPSYNVDVEELAKKMAIFKNELIRETMQKSSRKFAEANFNWENNKEYFLKLFK